MAQLILYNFSDKKEQDEVSHVVPYEAGRWIQGDQYDVEWRDLDNQPIDSGVYEILSAWVGTLKAFCKRTELVKKDIGLSPDAALAYYKRWFDCPPDQKIIYVLFRKLPVVNQQ